MSLQACVMSLLVATACVSAGDQNGGDTGQSIPSAEPEKSNITLVAVPLIYLGLALGVYTVTATNTLVDHSNNIAVAGLAAAFNGMAEEVRTTILAQPELANQALENIERSLSRYASFGSGIMYSKTPREIAKDHNVRIVNVSTRADDCGRRVTGQSDPSEGNFVSATQGAQCYPPFGRPDQKWCSGADADNKKMMLCQCGFETNRFLWRCVELTHARNQGLRHPERATAGRRGYEIMRDLF